MTLIAPNVYNTSQTIKPTSVEAYPDTVTKSESLSVAESSATPQSGLTVEGKKLIDALNKVDDAGKELIAGEQTLGDRIESFTYGALGIDHPNELEKISDDSYSAGQYLKGALTVGGLLLAIV